MGDVGGFFLVGNFCPWSLKINSYWHDLFLYELSCAFVFELEWETVEKVCIPGVPVFLNYYYIETEI